MHVIMSSKNDLFHAMPDGAKFLPSTIRYDSAQGLLTMEIWRETRSGRQVRSWIPFVSLRKGYYARARLQVRNILESTVNICEPEHWSILEKWTYDEATGIFKFNISGPTEISLKINEIEVEIIDIGDFSEDPKGWVEEYPGKKN